MLVASEGVRLLLKNGDNSLPERERMCLSSPTVRVKSRENTWIQLEEDRGRAWYSVRPQEGVGTAGDSVSDTLQRRRVLEGWLAAWRPGRAGRGEPSLTSPCAAPRPGEAAEVGKALEDAPQHRQLRDVHRALWRGQGRQWESKAHSTAPGNEESPFSGI